MDAYEVLGIEHGADAEQIKRAYRSLAQLHHPDKGGSAEQFMLIRKAYLALSKDSKPSLCTECHGSGMVKIRNGIFVSEIQCPVCWAKKR